MWIFALMILDFIYLRLQVKIIIDMDMQYFSFKAKFALEYMGYNWNLFQKELDLFPYIPKHFFTIKYKAWYFYCILVTFLN